MWNQFMCVLLFGTAVVGQLPPLPTSKVTLKVVDENGNAVPDAIVNFGFSEAHPKWGGGIGVSVKTVTDDTGSASGSGYSSETVGCDVHKDGYYDGGPSHIEFKDAVLGRWQPWNPVYKVVLKKILNPIPMYAKHVRIVVPAFDQPIGFDLAAADWVKPFGTGTTSDLVFTMSHTLNGPMDFSATLLLAFTNGEDGLQVVPKNLKQDQGWSRLTFTRNSPEAGYNHSWTTTLTRVPGKFKEEHVDGMGYFFRVRTAATDNGEIKSANYGKIAGDISIVGAAIEHPGIAFTYYFNPTGTTNLEFDPTKNLLENLEFLEQVQTP
jgi:hypothetical protein